MLEEIKKALYCKNDSELARKLKIDRSRVCNWRRKGWHNSTEALLKSLLEKIK